MNTMWPTLVASQALLSFSCIATGATPGDPNTNLESHGETGTESSTTSQVDTSDGGSSGTGGTPICTSGPLCELAGDGWHGPVVRQISVGTFEPCAAPFPEVAAELIATLAELQPATCGCACIPPTDAGANLCSGSFSAQSYDTPSDCEDGAEPTSETAVAAGGCQDTPTVSVLSMWRIEVDEPPTYQSAACSPDTTVTIAEPVLDTVVTLCAPQESAPGDLPKMTDPPFEMGVCVWREGDHACPPDFPDAQHLYKHIDDTRSCSACTCGPPQGECTGNILLGSEACDSSVLGFGAVVPRDGTCAQAVRSPQPQVTASVRALITGTEPVCEPSEARASGELRLAGKTTVCCDPT